MSAIVELRGEYGGTSVTREAMVWILALAVSLSLHFALFWHDPVRLSADDGRAKRQSGVTRLSFRVMPKPQPLASTPEVQPKQQPQPKPRPKPPEPSKARREAPAKIAEPAPEAPAEPVAAAPVDNAGDPQELERAQQHYLGLLLAHIEEHKFYPRAARRRGLQGVIQVSFLLHEDGSITALQVEDGHEVLRMAAQEAVQAALPLPVPPAEVRCPLPVRYGMEFKLN